jgi:hypothetical protein
VRRRRAGRSLAPSRRSSRPGSARAGRCAHELQAQYAVWLEALPDNLRDGATADALRVISDLDLTELKQQTRREDLAACPGRLCLAPRGQS